MCNLCGTDLGLVDSSLGFRSPELRCCLEVFHGALKLAWLGLLLAACAGFWASPSGEEAWGFRDASVDAARFAPVSPIFFLRTSFFLGSFEL